MFDPRRLETPPPDSGLELRDSQGGVELWLKAGGSAEPSPVLRLLPAFLRVFKALVILFGVIMLVLAGWSFWTQPENRTQALLMAVFGVAVPALMLLFMRHCERLFERVLDGMRGRVLRLLPTRLEGMFAQVHPDHVRAFEAEVQGGVLRARTDRKSVQLAQGLTEPQLQWCRSALSRALSLPG